ncbi:hypothetical protein GQ457_03G020410 [Hibiscus cannabinus]
MGEKTRVLSFNFKSLELDSREMELKEFQAEKAVPVLDKWVSVLQGKNYGITSRCVSILKAWYRYPYKGVSVLTLGTDTDLDTGIWD